MTHIPFKGSSLLSSAQHKHARSRTSDLIQFVRESPYLAHTFESLETMSKPPPSKQSCSRLDSKSGSYKNIIGKAGFIELIQFYRSI